MKTIDLINNLIVTIYEAGLRTDAYSTINTIASIIAAVFGLLHGMKLKQGIIAVAVSVAIERALSGPLMTAILFVENGFKPTSRADGVVVYAFIPLLAFLVSKLVRRSWKEIWDVMMPVPLVMFVGARIACTVAGCCRGFPSSWGVYNVKTDSILFPIQLLQAFVTVLILVAVIWREKKNNFVPDGRNVPIILISYGILRFFLEFLQDNNKIFLGCSSTSFHCLFMILIGVITLLIIRHSEKNVKKAI